MTKIHVRYYNGLPLCNIQKRWVSCEVSSTYNYRKVTCARCQKIARSRGFYPSSAEEARPNEDPPVNDRR